MCPCDHCSQNEKTRIFSDLEVGMENRNPSFRMFSIV
jgi:hypothetical protein